MTHASPPTRRRRVLTVLSLLVLGFIAVMETYSLFAITLDAHPPQRLWWEDLSLGLSWFMLALLFLGLYLLLRSSKGGAGALLVTANLLVFFAVVVFEIFAGGLDSKASLQFTATYFIVLIAGIAAAIHLKRRSSRSPQVVSN